MVSSVRPNAKATPRNPIPSSGKAAEIKAAPHPPKTSQKVPRNSAIERLISDDTDFSSLPVLAPEWPLRISQRRYHKSLSIWEIFFGFWSRTAHPDRSFRASYYDTSLLPRLVIMNAAARIIPPPIQAYGLNFSPSSSTPSTEPRAGSILRKTPALDAGTLAIPQFHKNIALVLQSSPLPRSAIQARELTLCTGGSPLRNTTQIVNMRVPLNSTKAVTCNGECVRIRNLFNKTHASATSSERTTNRSPARVGPWAAFPARLLLPKTIRVTPAEEAVRANQPMRSSLSCAKMQAPIARITGIVPTIRAAWLTVVHAS